MNVKKINFTFFMKTYGTLIILWLLSLIGVIVSIQQRNFLYMFYGIVLLILLLLPGVPLMIFYIHKKMLKLLPQTRTELEKQGMKIEYEYISRDTAYFVNYSVGRMAALFSMNPDGPQHIDATLIEDICTNDHKMFTGGTSFVACEFKLSGKIHRICTLMVTGGGTLHMKSPKVLEAISKADQICEMLQTTKKNAITRNEASLKGDTLKIDHANNIHFF